MILEIKEQRGYDVVVVNESGRKIIKGAGEIVLRGRCEACHAFLAFDEKALTLHCPYCGCLRAIIDELEYQQRLRDGGPLSPNEPSGWSARGNSLEFTTELPAHLSK